MCISEGGVAARIHTVRALHPLRMKIAVRVCLKSGSGLNPVLIFIDDTQVSKTHAAVVTMSKQGAGSFQKILALLEYPEKPV